MSFTLAFILLLKMHDHVNWEFLLKQHAGSIYCWGKWIKWILTCNSTFRLCSPEFGRFSALDLQ